MARSSLQNNLVPARNWFRRTAGDVGSHLFSWVEFYGWTPIALLSIFGAAQLAYFLTGRRPEQGADFLVDYSSKAVLAVYIIVATSIAKQALTSWLTLEQKINDWKIFLIDSLLTLALFYGVIFTFFK